MLKDHHFTESLLLREWSERTPLDSIVSTRAWAPLLGEAERRPWALPLEGMTEVVLWILTHSGISPPLA